jgi:hypothetical protein
MCEQLGGLAREGGPFLKIVTGAGEQSIAASSIAGSPGNACQINSTMGRCSELTLVHLAIALRMESHLE